MTFPNRHMKDNERAIVNSIAGSIMLLLLCVAAFHLFGSTPLWTPTKFKSLEFNPSYIPWLLACVPVGSLLGCIVGVSKVAWWQVIVSWLAGCVAGAWAVFAVVTWTGVVNPILVCGFGLTLIGFVAWLFNRKPRSLTEQIRSFDVQG